MIGARRTFSAAFCLVVIGSACSALAASDGNASVDRYYSKTYTDCMDAAGGSTYPMRDCIGAEHAAWDNALNQIYQVLMTSRSPAEKLELRDDERAWLKATARKCRHAGDDEAGGSLQNVEIDMCFMDETIRRAVYLRGLH
jgi:uncharacterized protein YecT (DUF1311 family)